MVYCSAWGCSTRSGMGKTMHRFPRDPQRRKEWVLRVRRKNWTPTNNSYLCSDHFEETEYESARADNLKKLKPFALPTVFAFTKSVKLRKAPRTRVSEIAKKEVLSKQVCSEHSYFCGKKTSTVKQEDSLSDDEQHNGDASSDNENSANSSSVNGKISVPMLDLTASSVRSSQDSYRKNKLKLKNNNNSADQDATNETNDRSFVPSLVNSQKSVSKDDIKHDENTPQLDPMDVVSVQYSPPSTANSSQDITSKDENRLNRNNPQLDSADVVNVPDSASSVPTSFQNAAEKKDNTPISRVPQSDTTNEKHNSAAVAANTLLVAKIVALERRVKELRQELARERRERIKVAKEKIALEKSFAEIYNQDQLDRLSRKSTRGVKWSNDTIKKGLELRAACGAAGYELLLAQKQPLPSMRSLRRFLHQPGEDHLNTLLNMLTGSEKAMILDNIDPIDANKEDTNVNNLKPEESNKEVTPSNNFNHKDTEMQAMSIDNVDPRDNEKESVAIYNLDTREIDRGATTFNYLNAEEAIRDSSGQQFGP